jgi:phospholipid N-methyltransferase
MFNSEFFPTPKEVLRKMLSGVNFECKTILDPSAGKGDIADYIKDGSNYRRRDTEIYCIEIEPELRHILHEKGYKVLAEDFLQYTAGIIFLILSL